MRIISSFKDYYDNAGCVSYCNGGLNSDTIYLRKTNSLTEADYTIYKNLDTSYMSHAVERLYGTTVELAIIGFCGKVYYTIVIDKKHYYDLDTLHLDYAKTLNEIEKKKFEKKCLEFKCRNRYLANKKLNDKDLAKKHLANRINDLKKYEAQFKDLFEKHRVPIFAIEVMSLRQYRSYKLTLNPRLKDYEFFKVLDVNQTYQEIEMYLNSVLVTTEQPKQITDNTVLLEAKGFDKKISFRHPIK